MIKKWLLCSMLCGLWGGQTAFAEQRFTQVSHTTSLSHGLKAEQLQKLRSLGIKVMVPGYVPKGFTVYSVYTTINPGKGPGSGPSYTIAYTGTDAKMFAIEAVSGGIGGPPADRTVNVTHPQWGNWPLLIQDRHRKKPFYLSEWIGQGPFYHVMSPAIVNRKLQPQSVTEAEMIKIMQGLYYLTS